MPLTQFLFSAHGRVGRRNWWGVLVIAWLFVALMDTVTPVSPPAWVVICALLVQVLLMWVLIVVSVKRWHDVNKSGWWMLVILFPVVGWIVALAFNGFVAGTREDNRFGESP